LQELVPQLEDIRQDKVNLAELADELRANLSLSQIPEDIQQKAADVEDKFSQLSDAIANR